MGASRFLRATKETVLQRDPLRDFVVAWDSVPKAVADGLEVVVATATTERAIQAYLEQHPILLAQHLGGGHGRWVIPQQRLGAEHVTDFMVAEKSSIGFEWQAVELEHPQAPMFTRSGDPSKQLVHAIRQIQDWRAWLSRNQNYAARPRDESGLGLMDVSPALPGLIIIGQRHTVDPSSNERRRQMMADLGIDIRTYDWLMEAARGHVCPHEKQLFRKQGHGCDPRRPLCQARHDCT